MPNLDALTALSALVNRPLKRATALSNDVARPAASIEPATLGLLAWKLQTMWSAPTTDAELKKRIVGIFIHEVVADVDDATFEVVLILH